jgi:hypothetical protein
MSRKTKKPEHHSFFANLTSLAASAMRLVIAATPSLL